MKFHMLFLAVIALALPLKAQETQVPIESWLEEHIVPLNSMRMSDAGLPGLASLEEALGSADIVFLGEQSHGDGSTFTAKTRIIRMLHEKLDFTVLAFESSLYQCREVWENISEATVATADDFAGCIFPVWHRSEQVQPLFEYLLDRSDTDNPLKLAGFDMNFTGNIPLARLKNTIGSAHPSALNENKYTDFMSLLENQAMVARLRSDTLRQQKVFNQLRQLKKALAQEENTLENDYLLQTLKNVKGMFRFLWKANFQNPGQTPEIFNIRDRMMADNLRWLKERMYPGEKIILWGATSHLMRNRDALDIGGVMVPMGEHLESTAGYDIYTLAFTSAGGETGTIQRPEPRSLPPASAGTLEHHLRELGVDHGFLDLSVSDLHPWLVDGFTARLLGHREISGNWTRTVDGIFFINRMEPSSYLE